MKKNSSWKIKLNHWFFNFHKEVVKTGVIGKKLLTASRTNAHLRETYEELGRMLEKGIDSGEIDYDSPKVRALIHTIKACKKDLEHIEKQVHKIKFSTGPKAPQDINDESYKKKNYDNKDLF